MKLSYDDVVSICDAHDICLPVDCVEMVVSIIEHATVRQADRSGASCDNVIDTLRAMEDEFHEAGDEAKSFALVQAISSLERAEPDPQDGGDGQVTFEEWWASKYGQILTPDSEDDDSNSACRIARIAASDAWQAALAPTTAPIAVAPASSASATADAKGAESERAAFEAYMCGIGEDHLYRRDVATSTRFGEYCRQDVQDQWETWQAALARSAPAHSHPIYQVTDDDGAWTDTDWMTYESTGSDSRRIVYATPQSAPAQSEVVLFAQSAATPQDGDERAPLKVTSQGVQFGNAWYSHEKITGYRAEQLNSGDCLVTGRAYMDWVQAALASKAAPIAVAEPIPMLLFCPKCNTQHIDAPEPREVCATELWSNPPHRSHLCHECGLIWRPADVPTNGVAAIETKGKADTWDATPPAPIASPKEAPAQSEPTSHAATTNIDQIHVGYRRGLKDAFSLAQGANLEVDGRTPKEKCAHILRTLADLLNGSERAIEVLFIGKPSFPFPARLLNESDESLAWRVDSWHKHGPAAPQPAQPSPTDTELTALIRTVEDKLGIVWFVPDDSETYAWRTTNTGERLKYARALLAAAQRENGS